VQKSVLPVTKKLLKKEENENNLWRKNYANQKKSALKGALF
jgi:hypothetical protein